ncbi:hypothetical protein APR48_29410 [Variovorax paradoxus]|nr:hypothetical protein APR52_07280 [Variovorax paradoxus]KPV13750.1 hypothetical protein APR49_01055 [Variovorax paradoxus]KPV17255.1 hypothetical protein APR51_27660 [Variovorax paradoxus]KPV27082.1 hypothetical protein APR48_29410 [Variovorax paradoxus]KPV28645.1 hypothetical protein APR47_28200 [Variovorax paradoxus]
MGLLLEQLQETVGDLLVCNESNRHRAQVLPAAKPTPSEADSTTDAQYRALEEAIRQQRKTEMRDKLRPGQPVAQPVAAAEVSLGSSRWRLAMNGWRLVADEKGFEVRLRPQERSLLLRVAHAPSQFLAPHEVRELNRSLATSVVDVPGRDEDAQQGEASIDLLHTKVIGRLRRRMRTHGHLLPLRTSAAGSVYVDEGGDLPRPIRRRPGVSKARHSQRSEKAQIARPLDIRSTSKEHTGGAT